MDIDKMLPYMAIGFFGALQVGSCNMNSCSQTLTCVRQAWLKLILYCKPVGGGNRPAMAGFHPAHMYTMEEVLGMIDDVHEPVCNGSDDEFDLDDEFDDNSR